MESITELEQLTLNGRSKGFLKEIAKWAKFLSIIGFIFIGIIVLLGIPTFFGGSFLNNLPGGEELPFDLGKILGFTYIVFGIIYFFPTYYLFLFSNRMKLALNTKDDNTLSDSFEMLKSCLKFLGVLTIILLSLYIIVGLSASLSFLSR